MRPEEFYLRDMVHAGEIVAKWANDIDWEFFATSPLYQGAIKFELMVIGEASSKISLELRNRYSELGWKSLKDFRNILAHEYFSLDLDLVWEAVTNRAANLALNVREILHAEYPDFPIDIGRP